MSNIPHMPNTTSSINQLDVPQKFVYLINPIPKSITSSFTLTFWFALKCRVEMPTVEIVHKVEGFNYMLNHIEVSGSHSGKPSKKKLKNE